GPGARRICRAGRRPPTVSHARVYGPRHIAAVTPSGPDSGTGGLPVRRGARSIGRRSGTCSGFGGSARNGSPDRRTGEGMADELSVAGRAAVVTGAGAGLGKAEALALARAGAAVVVNDMTDRADEVVSEIVSGGGQAVAVKGDVSDWSLAQSMIDTAVSESGSMDILVNNAGITRDTMIFNLTEDKWDDVLRVHLKGHAATSHAAAVHWRNLSKESGQPVYGRVVNTASEAFLFGPAGQPNYGAAKAGIVALTLSTASGLHKYGVTANAICPRARTEMTADTFDVNTASGLDPLAPE